MGVGARLKHAYNVFLNREPISPVAPYSGVANTELGAGYSSSPTRMRFGFSGERSILSSIYTRMAIDCASIDIRHIKKDEQDRYVDDVKSGIHDCINVEANIDQSGRAFLEDLYMTLLEGGHVVGTPVDMVSRPTSSSFFDILTIRAGIVVQWFPRHVIVEVYNDQTGRREQVLLEKANVAIIQNPLYAVMNEPNSTLQRLIRKLALLDNVDEKVNSGKLDMLIQLPFPIRTEGRRQDAAQRRRELELQLKDSTHGIGYIDATEKVVQLNRPLENNLLAQVESLLVQLYSQLGLTKAVMEGTADEAEVLNYHNRTLEPIVGAVVAEFRRKFLTKTARTQGHDFMAFRDPFKLVPMKDLAELADKFTRNEIVSSNEFRGFIGMRPAKDPKADMLINSNLTVPQTQLPGGLDVNGQPIDDGGAVDSTDAQAPEEDHFAEVNKVLDDTFAMLGVEG